jgi:hypothetical protein
VEYQGLHVFEVLHVKGVVEAELLSDLGDQLGAGLLAGSQDGRIGRGQGVEDDEGERADQRQQEPIQSRRRTM